MVLAPAPSVGLLTVAALAVVAGYVTLRITSAHIAPPRPRAAERAGPLRSEPPAVVNMLSNDATLTAAGFRATMIDLAARGWLRILPPDEEDELARVRPAAAAFEGDALLPHERLVLQHVLARYTSERAIPARYLAVDVRSSWWRRFNRLVADEATRRGLVRRRWGVRELAPPVALAVFSLGMWWLAASGGDTDTAVIDSIERRVASIIVLVAAIALVAELADRVRHPLLTHTDDGRTATEAWLAVRVRLVDAGMARLPPSSIDPGDRRLAYATAMCVAEAASVELPLAREDHFRAWSSMGGEARLVRVVYPHRVGYGLHPFVAIGGGLLLTFVGMRVRRFFEDVARGDALESLYERFPEQTDLIADIAVGLTALSWLPILIGLLMALGGAVDGFATIRRTGVVLRARRPAEVSPLPRVVRKWLERDRYSLYIAVDDGSSDTIRAWRCSERTAVPQGARATISATPVLGHVRSATPVGHRLVE
jgi:Predicted membrane protein (DUF2207)